MRSASPTRTAACAPRSRSSGCRVGLHIRASSNRSSRALRVHGSPMLWAPAKSRPVKSPAKSSGLLHRREDPGVEALHVGTQARDRAGSGHADTGCNHGVFNRGGATLIACKTPELRDERESCLVEHALVPLLWLTAEPRDEESAVHRLAASDSPAARPAAPI